jgi:hypothetical protein
MKASPTGAWGSSYTRDGRTLSVLTKDVSARDGPYRYG